MAILRTIQGVQDILEVYDDHLIIRPSGFGFLAKTNKGTKGINEIPYTSIVSIIHEEAGVFTNGFIGFNLIGGNSSQTKKTSQALKDINSFVFSKSNNVSMLGVKNFIFGKITGTEPQKNNTQANNNTSNKVESNTQQALQKVKPVDTKKVEPAVDISAVNDTLALLFSWVLGVVFMLASLGALLAGDLKPFVPIFIISLFLLPPSRKFTYSITNLKLDFVVRCGVVIGLLIACGVALKKPPTTSAPVKNENVVQRSTPSNNAGNITLGRWYDISKTLAIVREDSSYYLIRRHSDGSSGKHSLIKSGNKFTKFNDRFGAYYIIADNGHLKIYDNQGFIRSASPK